MNAFYLSQISDSFLAGLWKMSWQAAVLVGVVLLIQLLFGRWLNVRWRYNLWWIVLIRLMMPISFESGFSLFNVVKFKDSAEIRVVAPPPTVVLEAPMSRGAETQILSPIPQSRSSVPGVTLKVSVFIFLYDTGKPSLHCFGYSG